MPKSSYVLSALLTLVLAHSVIGQENKGWDRTVRVKEYLEPAIPHDQQQKAALDKLQQLRTKSGRQPNILIILVDDMGYGDVGCNGGGAMTGAPTPHIDALARDGLRLTSSYATPLCTPSRAAMMTCRTLRGVD